jgi:hypothetical protein
VFRFPALAALAGRRPLGGEREIALAALVCAHLVVGVLPEHALPADARARRATAARAWLGAMALPAAARASVVRVIDACGRDDAATVQQTLRALVDAIGRSLDPPGRRELERLAALLATVASS